MDTPSVFSGLSGITLMQQLNMMQQQANTLNQSAFQAASPQSSHNLSSTRSDTDEKMDETGSHNEDENDIEEIEPQSMELKVDETAEVQVQ